MMARYIDAGEFFQTLGFYEQSFDENRDFSARQTILQIMHELEHAPTADVAEVKHGEWLPVEYTYFGAKRYECSECKGDEFWEKRYVENKEKYCPNCGAKMDK